MYCRYYVSIRQLGSIEGQVWCFVYVIGQGSEIGFVGCYWYDFYVDSWGDLSGGYVGKCVLLFLLLLIISLCVVFDWGLYGWRGSFCVFFFDFVIVVDVEERENFG